MRARGTPAATEDRLIPVREKIASFWRWAGDTVDRFAALGGGVTVAIWLDKSGQLAALTAGPLGIFYYFGWCATAIVVGGVLYAMLRAVPYLGTRLGIYAGLYIIALVLAAFGDPEPLKELQGTKVDRASVMERYGQLLHEVRTQWRADVEAAGATGWPGDIPPMLDVEERGSEVHVTNLTDRPLCVEIHRRKNRMTCLLEIPNDGTCDIPPRSSRVYRIHSGHALRECATGELEFRVGNELNPEPSWWSRSALAHFDEITQREKDVFKRKPGGREDPRYARLPTEYFANRIPKLEALLNEPGRAERWRQELTAMRQARLRLPRARPRTVDDSFDVSAESINDSFEVSAGPP